MAIERISVPMNRVEGDLEVTAELKDGVVAEAWVSGTTYRGFERILVGRGARDGLVITPRVCGICTTSHLSAAAQALEAVAGVTPPRDAQLVRDLVLMAEHVQSDVRHGVLSFAADFTNPAWRHLPLWEEAVRRFTPLSGETVVEAVRETRKVLDIVITFGGQWPHSTYMVPGGVVCVPGASDLLASRMILARYRAWYERRILGCSIERWSRVASTADLDAWLDESPEHQGGALGFFIRFCRAASLDRIGAAHGTYVSYGGPGLPAGFLHGTRLAPFSSEAVSEHVAHSWYEDDQESRHPSFGETRPYATGHEGERYSWAKAPRYDGRPAETGPLAELMISGHPLVTALAGRGASVFVRELARLVRPATLLPRMERCLSEMRPDGRFYEPVGEIPDGRGAGLAHAARGALGHWLAVKDGRIERYQIVTPTGWNASPRDAAGVRGPMEEALVGTGVRDAENPVELGHVVRSFDACLVCTVHTVVRGRRGATVRVRA